MNPSTIDSNEKPYQPIKDRSRKVMSWSIISFFIGLGLIIILYPLILINFFTLTQIFIGFTVVGFLIPLKFYQQWFHFIKYEMILFNMLGVGPLFSGLFLAANILFSSNPQTVNYKIIGCKISGDCVDLELDSKIQLINPKITKMSDVNMTEFAEAKTIDITIADGIFGFKVIKNRTFKP